NFMLILKVTRTLTGKKLIGNLNWSDQMTQFIRELLLIYMITTLIKANIGYKVVVLHHLSYLEMVELSIQPYVTPCLIKGCFLKIYWKRHGKVLQLYKILRFPLLK